MLVVLLVLLALVGFLAGALVLGRVSHHVNKRLDHPVSTDPGPDDNPDRSPHPVAPLDNGIENQLENFITASRETRPGSSAGTTSHRANHHDSEWNVLPRTSRDYVKDLIIVWKDFEPRHLFRSQQFNPLDIYIPKDYRDMFCAAFFPMWEAVKRGDREITRIYAREVDESIERGGAILISWQNLPRSYTSQFSDKFFERLSTIRMRRDPRFSSAFLKTQFAKSYYRELGCTLSVRHGRTYAIRPQEFAFSSSLWKQQRQLLTSLVFSTVGWFEGVTLDEQSAIRLVKHMQEICSSLQ